MEHNMEIHTGTIAWISNCDRALRKEARKYATASNVGDVFLDLSTLQDNELEEANASEDLINIVNKAIANNWEYIHLMD